VIPEATSPPADAIPAFDRPLKPPTALAAEIGARLYREPVYAGLVPPLGPDLQGWNGRALAFGQLMEEVRPSLIFDVGVWKGMSCMYLAGMQRDMGIEGAVVAIDTFLGSPEHWRLDRSDRIDESLRIQHGWPGLYWQFISNVLWSGCEDRVLPLAQTSENAAVILQRLRVRADLIHIDAAHEYEPVLRDCRRYWALLKPGGVLVGDDYDWKGVAKAAHEFAAELGQELEVLGPKWFLRKAAGKAG
jgi:hypothetical protein